MTQPQRLLAAVEAGHVPSSISDLYPEDNVRFCELDDERWPCSAVRPRVWLEGDEVPAGVWVSRGLSDGVPVDAPFVAPVPLVEVVGPDYDAVVAAERERRTGDTR